MLWLSTATGVLKVIDISLEVKPRRPVAIEIQQVLLQERSEDR